MDFTQSMDNGYMIPTSVAVGSGEATDIRCVCDTVEDFKTFLDVTGMELRYEGLVTYEKVNKRLMVYEGSNNWKVVGEGGGDVDTSNFITLTQLSQQLGNYYTKTQTDSKMLEEKEYVNGELDALKANKFDDVSISGDKLSLKANGVTKKTITLPASTNGGDSTNISQSFANMDIARGTNGFNKKPIRPIISFSDDDGKIGVYTKWKPILEEKNIPLNVCVIANMIGGNYMSWEQIKELQDVYGCEILAHTVTHTNIGGHQTNKTWIEELKQSKMTLLKNGLNVRGFAYPNGGFWGTKEGLVHGTDNGHWMTGLFYDYAVITGGGMNNHPIKTNMGIDRVSIGSYGATNDSLDAWKAKVDECFENNSWLIFLTHIDDPAHTEEDTNNLKLLIDYIKEKQIDIVTFSEGFELFGNIIETPNCTITKQGSATLNVTSEVPNATKTNAGIVQVGDGISVNKGVISIDDSLYYSKTYIDGFLDDFESRILKLESNTGGGDIANSSPTVSSISAIKASPGANFQIAYTAIDSDGILMHELSLDNGSEYSQISPVSGDNNSYTYTTQIAEEGTYYCKLKVTDNLGNSTIKSFSVIIEVNKIIFDKVTKQGQAEIDLENGIYTLTDSDAYDNVMLYDTLGRLTDTSKTYKLCIKTLENEIVGTPSFEFNKSWILQGMTVPKLNDLEVGEVLKKEFRISQAITPAERVGYIQYAKTNTGSKVKVQVWVE